MEPAAESPWKRRRRQLGEKLGAFVLTRQEQRVIVFIVTAFVLGTAVKYYRNSHPHALAAPAGKSPPAAIPKPVHSRKPPAPPRDDEGG